MLRSWIKYTQIVIIILVVSITLSCNKEIDCEQSTQSRVKMGFYTVTDQKVDSAVGLYDVTLYGISIDSLFYNSNDNIYSISLLLSQLQDSSSYVLRIGTISDTLEFEYTRDLRFISTECGFATSFTINNFETTKHIIDSFQIVNPN